MNAPQMDLVTWTLTNDLVPENKTLLADPSNSKTRLTKTQVTALVRHLVAGFHLENGGSYLNGDVVCIHAFNSMMYPVIFHGVIGAGGCFTGTNPAFTETELEHHFRKSNTKFIITIPSSLHDIRAAANKCDISESHIFVFELDSTLQYIKNLFGGSAEDTTSSIDSARGSRQESPMPTLAGLRSFNDLLKCGEANWVSFKNSNQCASTAAVLLSTSGTSGLPKIAVRSHASLITECEAIRDDTQKPYEQVRLLTVPIFHAFASPLANINGLRNGVLTYLMPRFQQTEFLDTIERFQVTETALVPPILLKFLSSPSKRLQEQLSSLRTVWCGGAPLDGQVQETAIQRLLRPHARIVQVWGLTESGWLSTFKYPERDVTGSVGRLLPGYKARILDENDNDIEKGRGEVVVKSGSIMQGYLNDEDATGSAFTKDGWYRTGDIAELRAGKLYIVDRRKELIKVRGWQVAPAELEAVLVQHRDIVDTGVIGVKARSDSLEEIPEAYIVLACGSKLDQNDIKDFLLKYLTRYKVMDCRIIFTNSIPKSVSGKILRKSLREKGV